MTEPEIETSAGDRDDPTGRDRLHRNVVTSWLGHLVFIVAGFVLPRLIDRSLGQAALGVWDFGWSFVSYFSLAHVGIGSSVNRFVALHRAAGDTAELRRAVSSVMAVNVVASFVVQGLAAASYWVVPAVFGSKLGALTQEARVVVVLLGASLAVQVMFDAFRGVITGCHRWDIHNALNSGTYLVTVAVMVVALSTGGGLASLGVAYLAGTLAGELTRVAVAHRVCPELAVRPRHASWQAARPMLFFGLKTSLGAVSRLLLIQANYLFVASQLGPPGLAVYARPGALIRHVETFLGKFSFVLTPTAGSLQGIGRERDLRSLLLTSARYAALLALPALAGLGILGDCILRLWMGAHYGDGALVLAILAVGFAMPLINQTTAAVLTGLNLHGAQGVVAFSAALAGVVLSYFAIKVWDGGLVGAALAITVPLVLGSLFIPIYACRRLRIPLRTYARRVILEPVACVLPFVASLGLVRVTLDRFPLAALAASAALGALVLAPIYWRYALPEERRDWLRGLRGRAWTRLRQAVA